jgi:hypothetical protein
MAFDQATRNRLQKFVSDARKSLSAEFTRQLQNTYGLDPATGDIAALNELPSLSPSEQQTAKLLRDTLDHYLAASHKTDPHGDKSLVIAALDRIVREQAFTVLNRLAALRMAEARQFVMESISKGYQSKGFQLYQRIAGSALGETGQTYQCYLFSVFDELSLDLAVLFDRYSSQGRLFPRETVLLELLDQINHAELEILWAEDETVGWIYQYFNSKEERKKMRDESQAPRNSRELAVRNQFFTPRYVVEFLTDNTLGRIWYEMTQGNTALVNSCQYLVKRPNEIFLKPGEQAPKQSEAETTEEISQAELLQQTVYIEHRPIKDPRNIKMLDPACGSMHFGLYAFDLFEQIYSEAWDIEANEGSEIFFNEKGVVLRAALHETYSTKEAYIADVPRLIIEHNIHGVDIDPRAAQIAGLSLWLRAQKSWSDNAIKPDQRPQIQRSNIVCAEPMPGETLLLKEFTSQIQPRVLGQLVEEIFEKMELAGEAGTLLKIEEEIQSAIEDAKSQKDENVLEVQGGLFGGDKWEARKGKRYYNFGDVKDDFWGKAEYLILLELQRYSETATGEYSGQKRLFASDAARGFAFIDLCRKKFDVFLMNPPFGNASKKAEHYLNSTSKEWSGNLAAAFLIRSSEMMTENAFSGAIFDSSIGVRSTYEKVRVNTFLGGQPLTTWASLGWGVLDANVETSIMTRGVSGLGSTFLGLDYRSVEHKDEILRADILNGNKEFECLRHDEILKLPNAVLDVSWPIFLRRIFSENKPIGGSSFSFLQGHALEAERHYRLYWELQPNTKLSRNDDWSFAFKGGEYSPGYFSSDFVAFTGSNFGNVPKKSSNVLRNKSSHYQKGVCYGKRGEFVDAQPFREDHFFTHEGFAAVPQLQGERAFELALLNSDLFNYGINKYCGQHKQSGYVNQFPVPEFNEAQINVIEGILLEILNIKLKWWSTDPTEYLYSGPLLIKFKEETIEKTIEMVVNHLGQDAKNIDVSWLKLNSIIYQMYGVKEDDKKLIEEFCMAKPRDTLRNWSGYQGGDDELLLYELITHFIGETFGFLNSTLITTPVNNSFDDFFSSLPQPRPCVSTDNTTNSVSRVFVESDRNRGSLSKFVMSRIGGMGSSYEEGIGELIFKIFGKNLNELLMDTRCFFDFHFRQFSRGKKKAPIFLPLQSEKGRYVIWVCYYSLDAETLLTCVNDHIEPDLTCAHKDLASLNTKKERTIQEGEELVLLGELIVDLESFKDDILNACKNWRPKYVDGVQIQLAPLWRLFQHSGWRGRLEGTWKDLELGELDWSQTAFDYWPERILKKCYEDHSIAIVHNVASDLWEEIEVSIGKTKRTKLIWQPKEMTKIELDTYIQQKIAQG